MDNKQESREIVIAACKQFKRNRRKTNLTIWAGYAIAIFVIIFSFSDIPPLECIGIGIILAVIIDVVSIAIRIPATDRLREDQRQVELLINNHQEKYGEYLGDLYK